MIYRRKQIRKTAPGGFLRFQNAHNQSVYGFGDGDYIRLKDEFGHIWRGTAEREDDNSIRYRFRDESGQSISGISDSYGIILRDEKGNSWRGFVD
jgi:hypothetical protein